MIRHLLKMVWNRKWSNLLIVLEIFVSFLVIFSLAASGFQLYATYWQPLGFKWQNVWTVDVDRNTENSWMSWDVEDVATFRRVMEAAAAHPQVAAVAGVATAPYSDSTWMLVYAYGGEEHGTEVTTVTPELANVLGIEVVAGRWFEPGDEAMEWTPVIIDRELAHALVGNGDAVGVDIKEDERTLRVVGVVDDFRRQGELTEDQPMSLEMANLSRPETKFPLHTLVIRLQPETTADFEEALLESIQPIARGWTFSVTHLEESRARHFRDKLIPLASVGVVAGFLLIMVVLGLTGVMWQNVTRRTREFGLRRAVGAHRTRIQWQIVGEVAVTAGLGVLAGGVLAAQVPLLGPFSFVPYAVVMPALAAATALILLLAAVCGLYPSWTATRIHPAEALHYE